MYTPWTKPVHEYNSIVWIGIIQQIRPRTQVNQQKVNVYVEVHVRTLSARRLRATQAKIVLERGEIVRDAGRNSRSTDACEGRVERRVGEVVKKASAGKC